MAQVIAENGAVVTELGSKVDPLVDEVAVDGKVVRLSDSPVTIMLHKPAGVVTTMKAQFGGAIVADLVPTAEYPGLFPIGRLDADTTGLLLFSTDGELGNQLLHPRHHVPKTYLARVKAPLGDAAAERLRSGVDLDDGPAQPADVEIADKSRKLVRITVREGRYHQVKRMFEAAGDPVVSLHRESFGPLMLGKLKPGEWRLLTDDEVGQLQAAGKEARNGEERHA